MSFTLCTQTTTWSLRKVKREHTLESNAKGAPPGSRSLGILPWGKKAGVSQPDSPPTMGIKRLNFTWKESKAGPSSGLTLTRVIVILAFAEAAPRLLTTWKPCGLRSLPSVIRHRAGSQSQGSGHTLAGLRALQEADCRVSTVEEVQKGVQHGQSLQQSKDKMYLLNAVVPFWKTVLHHSACWDHPSLNSCSVTLFIEPSSTQLSRILSLFCELLSC
nr:uncharacterized protein LOC123289663 [Equus asinus]